MLFGTLGARLLGNLLTGKGTIRAGEDTTRLGFIMRPRSMITFEIKKYYLNEPNLMMLIQEIICLK